MVNELRVALADLEIACDNLAATRSPETYNSMIHRDDAHDQLIALDACRMRARGLLAALSPNPVDGDTIRCGKTRYRLLGIDAPEMPGHCRKGRRCAPGDPYASKRALSAAMKLGPIRFQHVATDRYGRPVGIVWAGSVNLPCWQLSRGLAIHRPDYDRTKQLRCE